MQQSFSSLLKVFQCPHVFYKKKMELALHDLAFFYVSNFENKQDT